MKSSLQDRVYEAHCKLQAILDMTEQLRDGFTIGERGFYGFYTILQEIAESLKPE